MAPIAGFRVFVRARSSPPVASSTAHVHVFASRADAHTHVSVLGRDVWVVVRLQPPDKLRPSGDTVDFNDFGLVSGISALINVS